MAGNSPAWGWGCSRCGRQEKGELEEAERRAVRNCDNESYQAFYLEAVPELRRCPWAVIPDDAWAAVTWWSDWREFRALPFGGSDIMEQPAFVFEAIRHCQSVFSEIEAKKRQQEQAKLETQLRKSKP